MRRMVLSLTAIALLTFSACGARRESVASTESSPTTTSSIQPQSMPASKAEAASPKQLDVSLTKVSDGQALPENTGVERKIIRNAELTIETQNPNEAFRKVDAESFVRLGKSCYWVPPEYVGQHVIIEHGEQPVVVRAGDLVIAEHAPAPRPGACMTQKEHIEALWRLSLQRAPAPPAPHWHIGFREPVQTTPLAAYEEMAQ